MRLSSRRLMKRSILPSESQVISAMIPWQVGGSLRRCTGMIGKSLADGPGVGQGLKDAEVAVIDVGQPAGQPFQFIGDMLHLFGVARDRFHDVPEHLLGQSPLTEGDGSVLEEPAGSRRGNRAHRGNTPGRCGRRYHRGYQKDSAENGASPRGDFSAADATRNG